MSCTIIGLMILVCIIMLLLRPEAYFTGLNLRSMIFQFPEYGILALGMMACMIAGGIDLSLVGIMNFTGVSGGADCQEYGHHRKR